MILNKDITIDLEKEEFFHNQVDFCVGTGRMDLALHEEYLKQLELVQKEIGFKHIRGHGLFTDYMAIYQETETGEAEYNFTYLDRVMDSYLKLNIRPFIELGFMPEKMASGKQTVFYWKGNVTPPADYKRWTNMVVALLQHLMERYGREEVLTWPIEVWNEPNLPGFWEHADMQEYFKLFHKTFTAIKEFCPEFGVGGPAVCGGSDEVWISAFMKYCHENKLAIDFVTRHHYTTDFPNKEGHYGYADLMESEDGFANLKTTRDIIDAYEEYKGLPIHITEYNTSYIPNCPLHDTNQNAAYIARQLSRLGNGNESYSYWTFGDVFEEQGVPFTPFHGGFGLVADGCIPKPTFWSFVFFKNLKKKEGTCIYKDDNGVMLKYADGSIRAVFWNDTKVRSGKDMKLKLTWPKGTEGSLLIKTVDEDSCNPLKLWHDLGEPANPTEEINKLLREAAFPKTSSQRLEVRNGAVVSEHDLAENGVIYLEYKPGKVKSDRGYSYDRVMQHPDPNPITRMDYPDADVIRVEDTYYMVNTTMHFMPGCEILRSYDLIHWEHATFVYDTLDGTPGQRLEGDEHIYGKGMWAASLRYHQGTFYMVFVCNDTHKTYLYTTKDLYGTWEKRFIEGFFHDCSLLFDDDGKVYIAYGNKNVYITELNEDLTAPKEGGLHRLAVSDEGNPSLGYEGSHFYKINGKYYLFFIHSKREYWRRVESCFVADSIDGEFVGGDVFDDDRGFRGSGCAQGGIVDTPEGDYYAMLFQDSGAVGRLPILVPVHFENDYPVFGVDGKVPAKIETISTRPGYEYAPLYGNENFKKELPSYWQFNHEPSKELIRQDMEEGKWYVTTDKIASDLCHAKNTLTQRTMYPGCAAEVLVQGNDLKEGDYTGLCILQGDYCFIGITRKDGELWLVAKNTQQEGLITKVDEKGARVRIDVDYSEGRDEASVSYKLFKERDGRSFEEFQYHYIPEKTKLSFKLDHFTGARFGLVTYATKEIGGTGCFSDFKYIAK